jgi:hypothetical protein
VVVAAGSWGYSVGRMSLYRSPPARPRWAIACGYEGGPPIARGASSTRRFVAIFWTSLNLVLIMAAGFLAYWSSVMVLVDGGFFSARAWIPAAAIRGGTCAAAGLILAIALYPANVAIFRWIYRPERTREPQRLAQAMVALVVFATIVGLAQSVAAHQG